MNQLSRLKVNGFRRLHALEIELRPLCVMIGANGSGKTSLLDVLALLSSSADRQLKQKISDFGGIGAILTNGRASELSLEVEMPQGSAEMYRYSVAVRASAVSYQIAAESLSQPQHSNMTWLYAKDGNVAYAKPDPSGKSQFVGPTWPHDPMETALSQYPRFFPGPEVMRSRIASSSYYHALSIDARAPVRLPQPLRPATLPGRDGEDLVSCLFYLREAARDRFEVVEDTLRAAFPGFERLDFPPVAAGTLAMTWRDANFSQPFYMHQLSEGTLRFLWLVALLQSPGLAAITLLDEPEVSLHPELLGLLADLFREAAQRTQIVVATHADRLVRFLNPSEVLVFDVNDEGLARANWADGMDLEKWLDEYTLDEVWQMGRMGGRS